MSEDSEVSNQPLLRLLEASCSKALRWRNWLELISWQNTFAQRAYVALPLAAFAVSSDLVMNVVGDGSRWRIEVMYLGALTFLIGQLVILLNKPPTLKNESDPVTSVERIGILQDTKKFKKSVEMLEVGIQKLEQRQPAEKRLKRDITIAKITLNSAKAKVKWVQGEVAMKASQEADGHSVSGLNKYEKDILTHLSSKIAGLDTKQRHSLGAYQAVLLALLLEEQRKPTASDWRAEWTKVEVQRRVLDAYSRSGPRKWATSLLMLGVAMLFAPAAFTVIGGGGRIVADWFSIFSRS